MGEGAPRLQGKPFEMQQSEAEIAAQKEKSLVISVRLNAEEQAALVEIKKSLNFHTDSTALKTAFKAGVNVLLGTFGAPLLRYISNPSRRREEIEEVIGRPAGLQK